jgi:hypothetical protein
MPPFWAAAAIWSSRDSASPPSWAEPNSNPIVTSAPLADAAPPPPALTAAVVGGGAFGSAAKPAAGFATARSLAAGAG